MNRARTVRRDMADVSALYEVYDVAVDASSEDMRAHDEDARVCRDHPPGDVCQVGMFERRRLIVQSKPVLHCQIVRALRQRQYAQTGPVEKLKLGRHA